MPEKGMNEVATELLRLTREKKLTWKPSRRENDYTVSFPEMSFSISYDRRIGTYRLEMVNESGAIVDSLRQPVPVESVDSLEELPELIQIYNLAVSYIKETSINKALDYLKSR